MLKEEYISNILHLIAEAKNVANTWGLKKAKAGKLHEVLLGGFVNHYAREYQKHKNKGDKAAHETAMSTIEKVKTRKHASSLNHMAQFTNQKTGKNPKEEHDNITSTLNDDDYNNHLHHAKRAAKEFISHLRSNGVKDLKVAHMTANKNDVEKLTGGKDSSDLGNNSDIIVQHGHKNKGGGFHGLSIKSGESSKLNNPGMGKISKVVDEYHEKITGKKGAFAADAMKHEKTAQENHHAIVNKHAKLIKQHAAKFGVEETHHITKENNQHYLSEKGLEAIRKSKDDKVKSVYKELGDSRLTTAKQPIAKSLRNHVSRMMATQGKHKEKKEFFDKLTNLERPEGSMPIAKINTKNEKVKISYPKQDFDNHHKNSRGQYNVGGAAGGEAIGTNVSTKKGMKVNITVDSSPGHGKNPVVRNGLHVWDKSAESLKEEATVNVMGSGINGLGTATGGIQGVDPILGATPRERKKKFKQFRRKALGEAVTTKPSGNGYHDVYVNGEKHPDYEVVNGSGGNSSMDKQTYGIRKGDKVQWVGCLKDTRKRLNKMLGESGPFSGKPKKLEPLKDRIARASRGVPGGVDLKAWMDDKKRRKAEYMKNRERRDENT